MAETKVEKVTYRGWDNCYRVANGSIELIATSDVGPRIIHCGFAGAKNLFKVYDEMAGQTGGDDWKIYGGHRLWHSPEDKVRTYERDNEPIAAEEIAGGIRLQQKVEERSGIEKTIEVILEDEADTVTVVHRLKNQNVWPIELGAWALSVMEPGGFAVVPLPTGFHPDNLLPNRTLTLWPYTQMQDDRYLFGADHILIRQEKGRNPTKIGVYNDEGWGAYYLAPFLFVKRFEVVEGVFYPDHDSTMEVYTNSDMLELETVGPLVLLEPGEEIIHEERWQLFQDLELSFSEEDVKARLLPLIGKNK
jgi:hypothetical protein